MANALFGATEIKASIPRLLRVVKGSIRIRRRSVVFTSDIMQAAMDLSVVRGCIFLIQRKWGARWVCHNRKDVLWRAVNLPRWSE